MSKEELIEQLKNVEDYKTAYEMIEGSDLSDEDKNECETKAKEFISAFVGEQENEIVKVSEPEINAGLDFLIADENEAIAGYDRIIQLLKNAEKPDEEKIKKLEFIKKQEYEHIEILKGLK